MTNKKKLKPLMTLKQFDSLSKRDFENGAVLDEIRDVIKAYHARPSAGVSVEAIEKIIHLRTFEHRNEDGKFGISYIKGCGYCNDRPWLRSIAESIYAMIKGEA